MAVQKPVLLVFSESPSLVDADFFASLGTQTHFVNNPSDVFAYLKTTRPHALCVIALAQTYLARPQWLREVERKSIFDGLRVVAFLITARGGKSQLNKVLEDEREIVSRIRLSASISLREFIVEELPPFPQEVRKKLATRVSLALGMRVPFAPEDDLLLAARANKSVEIAVPGRLSWVTSDGLVSVECGARIAAGTVCKLAYSSQAGVAEKLEAVVVSSSSNKLRFNFGSEVTMRVSDSDKAKLNALHVNTAKDGSGSEKPILRSLVLLRKTDERERVAELLRARRCEVRIPLLSKNIRNDVMRLSPHLVVLEESFLSAQNLGEGFLDELRAVIDSESRIAVVGDNAVNFVGERQNVHPMTTADMEISLRHILEKVSDSAQRDNLGKVWFPTDSDTSCCLVELVDRALFMGNTAIVIASAHTYRSLCNVFLRFEDSSSRFLVKNCVTYVSGDAWKLAAGQHPTSLYMCELVTGHNEYGREFQKAVALADSGRLLGVSLGLNSSLGEEPVEQERTEIQTETQLGAQIPEQVKIPSEARQNRNKFYKKAIHAPVHQRTRQAGDFSFSRDYPLTKSKVRRPAKPFGTVNDWLMLMGVFLVIAVIVVLLVVYGQANESFLTGSFERLFQSYGK